MLRLDRLKALHFQFLKQKLAVTAAVRRIVSQIWLLTVRA